MIRLCSSVQRVIAVSSVSVFLDLFGGSQSPRDALVNPLRGVVCTLCLKGGFAVNKNRKPESVYCRLPAREGRMRVTSAIKIHGGKHYLAPRILSLLPPRDGPRPWHLWREPYFGGGSVTLALDPAGLSEAVNDIDGELINFWKVLQTTPDRMLRALWATPLSDDMFEDAANFADHSDAVKRATAFFIRCRQSRQGLRRDFATPTRRLRRGMNENVSAWLSAIEGLQDVHARLQRIEIRSMEAVEFIRKYDDEAAVFYCDPPYLHETRSTGGGEYSHEMSNQQHMELLETLAGIKGRFLLSGYSSRAYLQAESANGWTRVDIPVDNKASSKKAKEIKTECVWMNY